MGNVIILVYFMTDGTTHYNGPTYIAVRIVRVPDLHLYVYSVLLF